MKRLIVVLAAALLATGCEKKDKQYPPMGGVMPGTGMNVTKTYSGAVQSLTGCLQRCYQDIAVNADVIDFPADRVNVYLCRNADCQAGPLPAVQCAQVVPLNGTTACYTATPSVSIVFGNGLVRLVDAYRSSCIDQQCTQSIPGYSTYVIQTSIVR